MFKKVVGALISIKFLVFQSLLAQNLPEQSSNFSLAPSELGALQNSVNLYTGQVSFPMTVASLPGRGGLVQK